MFGEEGAPQGSRKNAKAKSPKMSGLKSGRKSKSPPGLFKQMAQLSIASKKNNKQSKMISSKSLSALLPKNLFSRTKSSTAPKENQQVGGPKGSKLMSTKSFPAVRQTTDNEESANKSSQFASSLAPSGSSLDNTKGSSEWTFDQANLSPIVALDRNNAQHVLCSSPVGKTTNQSKVTRKKSKPSRPDAGSPDKEQTDQSKSENKDNGRKKAGRKFKALKSTTLALRDVKNSIGLRIRAKNQNQAFARLTNELATTPNAKLYSPFNIYTDSCTKGKGSSKSGERNLALRGKQMRENSGSDEFADCSIISAGSSLANDSTATPTTSPKQRIALRHKKHLLNASKFDFFVSPTGKHREAVKDVENLQRCIEDISDSIRARDQLRL